MVERREFLTNLLLETVLEDAFLRVPLILRPYKVPYSVLKSEWGYKRFPVTLGTHVSTRLFLEIHAHL